MPEEPPSGVCAVSHTEPVVTVNEIGAPLVESVTVWFAGGNGGAAKFNVVALSDRVDGAGVTTSVTGIVVIAPLTVTVIAALLYVAAGRLVGFTRTLSVAGSVPLDGLTVNHGVLDGVTAAVNAGAPELAFTVIVCAAGSVAAPT